MKVKQTNNIVKVVCYSGGKDSTAMLITLLEKGSQIDEILYVDVGNWMWSNAKEHLELVEKRLGVSITRLDVAEEIRKGFERWGFPSFFNRWCTGVKKEAMRQFLQKKYKRESNVQIIQYIGYCADEEKRSNGKLWATFDAEYPLVDEGVTTSQALQICKEYGFDFGGVYEHHEHYNCWLCPMQKVNELEYIFKSELKCWERLRRMQFQTDGYYQNGLSIFDFEKKFWLKQQGELRDERMKARKKYNTRRS